MATLREQWMNSVNELKPGEYFLEYGRCFYCGNIEKTEGEDHSYFYEGKEFLSQRCYSALRGLLLEIRTQGKLKKLSSFR